MIVINKNSKVFFMMYYCLVVDRDLFFGKRLKSSDDAKLLLFHNSDGSSFFQKSGKKNSTNGGFLFQIQLSCGISVYVLKKKMNFSKSPFFRKVARRHVKMMSVDTDMP